MANKFFAIITAPDQENFFKLHMYGIDLVFGTAKTKNRKSPTIEALLTKEEIEKLVKAGYSVNVKEEALKMQAREKVSDNFQEWLKDMQERRELS